MEGEQPATRDSQPHESMISSNSPYQPTTEPVPNRRPLCAGLILDMQYLKSLSGILKLVEIMLCIIVLICLGFVDRCMANCSGVSFLRVVAGCALFVTLILWIVSGLALKSKITFINWSLTDLINAVIDSILFLISSSVMASKSATSADKAALVFGYIAMIAYGISAWIGYRAFVLDRHKKRSNPSHIPGVARNEPEMED